MNKTELIEVLSVRLGDRKSAAAALDAFVTEVQNAVTKGDKVAITGFGVFEKRERAARTARNPRTGEAVKVKKTSAPAFRPGAGFKELVAAGKVSKVAAAQKSAPVRTIAAKAPAKSAPAKSAPVKTIAAAKTTPAKKVAPAKTTAKTAPAKATPAKTARTTATKAATKPATKATKATMTKATATKTTATKAPARTAAKAPAKRTK